MTDEKIFAGGIIFAFEFHCKRIVAIQRFENWLAARKAKAPDAQTASHTGY